MNRSKQGFCDHTWNPITGCRHGCDYCYAKRMTSRFSGDIRLNLMAKQDYMVQESPDGSRDVYVLEKPMLNKTGHALVYPFGFEPTFHRYRMNILDKLRMGNNVFVGAMADMFGEWVPDEWIRDVVAVCEENTMHNYLFLTKNPQRYTEYGVPEGLENFWYGTTITREEEMSRFNLLPVGCKVFVSMEPILEDLAPEQHNILFRQVNWIILGAETGIRRNKVSPPLEWIEKIVLMVDAVGVPVFMKDSLLPIVGEKNMRREFPPELLKKKQSEKYKARLESNCCICGIHSRKNQMISLSARSKRGQQPKHFTYMCKTCFKDFCSENHITEPKLEGLHGEETKLPEDS